MPELVVYFIFQLAASAAKEDFQKGSEWWAEGCG
jgi:hypothetical protein